MFQISKSKKQALLLYATTIIGTVVGVLASVINTRNLSPIEYGDVKYVNNLLSCISGFLLLGYFTSGSRLLALAKSRQEAKEIKGSMIVILLITIIVLMAIMIPCAFLHKFILHKDFYRLFLYVIPVCFGGILFNYINTSSMGDNSITTISLARLLPHSIYVLIALIIYANITVTSTWVLILQNAVTVIVLIILLCKNGFSFHNIKSRLINLNNENKQYGIHVYLGSLFTITVPYLAGISLGLFNVDNSLVGFYTLAISTTQPLAMVPNVIGTTLFKRFALQNKIDRKIVIFTYLISFATLALFCALIFPVVDFLYDDAYSIVSYYACFIGIAAITHGLGDVFYRFLGAHGRGKEIRNVAILTGILSMLGYTLGVYLFGIWAAIITRIIVAVIYYSGMYYYYRQYTVLSHEI